MVLYRYMWLYSSGGANQMLLRRLELHHHQLTRRVPWSECLSGSWCCLSDHWSWAHFSCCYCYYEKEKDEGIYIYLHLSLFHSSSSNSWNELSFSGRINSISCPTDTPIRELALWVGDGAVRVAGGAFDWLLRRNTITCNGTTPLKHKVAN